MDKKEIVNDLHEVYLEIMHFSNSYKKDNVQLAESLKELGQNIVNIKDKIERI